MDERFGNNQPIDEQTQEGVSGARLAALLFLMIVPLTLAALIVLKPTAARTAIAQVAKLFGANSSPDAASPNTSDGSASASIAGQPMQRQAEGLLQKAIGGSGDALDEISTRMPDWQGQLTMTPRLTGLLDAAINANDMRVRSAALDLELAANDLAKTPGDEDQLIARIDKEPTSRPWGLWMLGALGNRGGDRDRALVVLVQYSHDADETTRYWAVSGMSLIGSDPTVPLLLQIFRNDASPRVRQAAGCGLAQCGMLTKEQRRKAVPALVRYAGDASLDASTRAWVYQALRDITGARVANDPAAWRDWLSENGVN